MDPDGVLRSDLGRRLGLCSDAGPASHPTLTHPTRTTRNHPKRTDHTMIDATGRPQSVLVLGGASEIAQAIVAGLVPGRCRTVVLAGRPSERLDAAAEAARAAGADVVETVAFDTTDLAGRPAVIEDVFDRFGDIDLVLAAAGALGDQAELEADPRGRGRADHHQLHRPGRRPSGRRRSDAGPGPRTDRGHLVGGR